MLQTGLNARLFKKQVMKNLIQLLLMSLLFAVFSCKSVEKLAEQGRYDDAIELAVKKLAGEKNKKTAHVKALEKSFKKINRQDLNRIEYLKNKGDESVWDQIHSLAISIDRRQNIIDPLIPLISEEGYEASFDWVDATSIKLQAENKASQYHFDRGIAFLYEARTRNNRNSARAAYAEFETVQRYNGTFPNIESKMDSAIYLGEVHVLVNMLFESSNFVSEKIAHEILAEIGLRDQFWTKYYVQFDTAISFDYVASFEISDIIFSPEREQVRQYQEQVPSTELDETSSDSTTQVYKTIPIFFEEVTREKHADLAGHIYFKNFATGDVVDTEEVVVGHTFLDKTVSYNSDQRARQSRYRQGRVEYPAPFPTDYLMTQAMIPEIAKRIRNFIRNKRL